MQRLLHRLPFHRLPLVAALLVLSACSSAGPEATPQPTTIVYSSSLAILAATATYTAAPTNTAAPTPTPLDTSTPAATVAPPTPVPPTVAPTAPPPTPPTVAPPTSAPAVAAAQAPAGDEVAAAFFAEGEAARMSDTFQGEAMANGQPYNKDAFVAAHKELPLGAIVRVTNLNTGLTTTVTVTDRISPAARFVIDLSRAAAVALGMPDMGTAPVRLEVVQ